MKLTAVLLTVVSLQVSAAAFSQQISLKEKNAPLIKVLQEIKRQSGYQLLYNTEAMRKARPVTVELRNSPLELALALAFRGQPFTYELLERTILVKAVEEARQEKPRADTLIRGTVKLETRGLAEGAPGISILEKGTRNGVQTDANGSFAIRVQENAKLVISILGFKTVEADVSSGNFSEIILQEEMQSLSEVVVTGYSVQEKRAITGAIASVKGTQIENIPLQSFDKAIQGKAAGVLVQTATGVPGGPVRISIRGVGSISAGTEPLYIVDGVQFNSTSSTSVTATNPLAYINPNDIESIEILKDAAAASIYGAQAANGVVLITTKKGAPGKTNISLNYYQGISSPMPLIDVLSSQQALAMRQEAVKNRFPTRTDDVVRESVLQEYGLSPDLTDAEIAALPTYDWQDAAFRTGKVLNAEMAASGGNEKTTFYASGAFNKHDGNVIGIDFLRGTAKLRLGHQASRRLSFDMGVNLGIITQNGNTGSQGNTTGFASPQYAAAFMPPTVPVYNADGSFNAYQGMPGTGFNPVQAAVVDDNEARHRAAVGNFSATYNILDNLSFKTFYGIDYRLIKTNYYRDHRTPNGAAWNGYLQVENIENLNFITNQVFNYNKQFAGKHNLSALLGAEYRSDTRDRQFARGEGFATYQFRTLQSAAVPASVSGAESAFRRLGFFTQANYDFDKKYMLSGTLRYDGSSRFGANNRMGFFPAISAGWDISREKFMDSSPWIEQFKLRVGYGVTGNDQIDNVSARGLYQGEGNYNGLAGIRLVSISNTELGWERNVTLNIGTDFSFFDRRLYGAVELFHRASRDLLLNRPLPWTSGFDNIDDNVGELVNRGLEIELNSENIRKPNFSWSTNFNISFLDNEVVELYDGLQSIGNTVRVGMPLKIYYRPEFAGVNSATGRPMWYDANGNITYRPQALDNKPTKDGWLSDYFGGLTNIFRFKGLELNTLFHYDMGRTLANDMNLTWYGTHGNTAARNTLARLYEDRWTTPGEVTTVPRVIDGGAEVNGSAQQTASTRYLEDASFIRLREVSLAYQFSSRLLERYKLSRIRVYLTGVNLYTWTAWTGYDPEVGFAGSVSSNQGIIPQTRSFTAGIQVGL